MPTLAQGFCVQAREVPTIRGVNRSLDLPGERKVARIVEFFVTRFNRCEDVDASSAQGV